MNDKKVHRYRILNVIGGMTLAFLVGLTLLAPPAVADIPGMLLFCALITFNNAFGVSVGGGNVSLVPTALVAAYLALGWVPAGWVACCAAVIHGLLRIRWGKELDGQAFHTNTLVATTAANVTMHTLGILASGLIYQALGGVPPITDPHVEDIFLWIPLGGTFLLVNYLIGALVVGMRGREHLNHYLRSIPHFLIYEGTSMPFAPLIALIHTQLGATYFTLFALILVAITFINRNLDQASKRLERRIQELHGLQAVGQTLSSSLDIDVIVNAIYEQVAKLMPAENFYVALHNPDVDEVSFPLAVEDGVRVRWRTRRTGNGLTEHLLRTRQPLLICSNVGAYLEQIGITAIGKEATCWLGVPLVAGDEALGAIAVQSYTTPQAYDTSHQEILSAIAAQAAVTVQNARLYARTDEALEQRVRELNSILRTTREGVMLLDLEWCVLATNRALAELIGASQLELTRQPLSTFTIDGGKPLIGHIGYTLDQLRADCADLNAGKWPQRQDTLVMGPAERHVERTLTPVRDREGKIGGWLLVFRDRSEEVELARLREEMTHMLVHDLRSPLTVIIGSIALMKGDLNKERTDRLSQLIPMAEQNSERMLNMVNELLDIGKLESGKLPLNLQPVHPTTLLKEAAGRLAPLAAEGRIRLTNTAEDDLPLVHVDRQLVGRVINNLLDNAIKFTPDEGCIHLWARRAPEQPDRVLIGVTDNGAGIPQDELLKIFEKFHRTAIEGRRPGTGLGLAFCKLVVEAHDGEISVESALGQGSTFTFSLPVAI